MFGETKEYSHTLALNKDISTGSPAHQRVMWAYPKQLDKTIVSRLTSPLVKVLAQCQDVHSCPQVGSAAVRH
jgi:hypothetical protein